MPTKAPSRTNPPPRPGHALRPLGVDVLNACRNVFRQGHRTRGALAAVVFGVAAYLLAAGFIDWTLWAMREEVIGSRLGHLQIAKPGYFDLGTANPWRYVIADDGRVERLLRADPRVAEVAPRLAFTGLVSRGDTTLTFVGEGVDPAAEHKLLRLLQIVEGDNLAGDDPQGVILGRGLAASLDAKVGDAIVMLSGTRSGGLNGVEARVRGIFSTASKDYDAYTLRAPLGLAQSLVRAHGVHKWVVVLDRTESTQAVLHALQPALAAAGLEIAPWTRFADFYNKTARLFERQVEAVALIIAIIIVLGISNALTMAVLERTTEIGTALALGSRRRQVLRQFVFEGLLVGIAGGLLGIAIGMMLAALASRIGIPMPPAPGMDQGYVAEISVGPRLAGHALLLALATAFVASLYPASRAARLSIVDALRHGR